MMDLRTKIYIAAAAVALVLISASVASLLSSREIKRLERDATAAKQAAGKIEKHAAELERSAEEFKEKNKYLEEQLSALRLIAAKQDEELKTLTNDTDLARGDVRRARAVRTLESTTADLCRKLAELGHPCG